MVTNDFLPFAVGGGANVLTQAQYAALTSILSGGYQSGVANSAQMNKTWRQSSIMAAVLAQFAADYSGNNSTDDGTTATLEANLVAAIRSATKTGVILADTGAANAYTAVNAPPLASGTWVDGVVQQIRIAHANTGASTYAPDGLTAIPIYGLGLQPLQGGELALNGIAILVRMTIPGVNSGNPIAVLMECAGGAQQVAPATQSQHALQLGQATGRLLNIQVFSASGTYTPTAGAKTAIVDAQGAGGQGGGSAACSSSQNSFGTGGHSGSRAIVKISLTGVNSVAVTVGAGGSNGTAGNAGQTGATSSFGTYASCPGGAGGGVLGPTTGSFIGGNSSALPSPTISGVLQTILSQQGNSGQPAICIAVGTALSGAGGISPAYSGSVTGLNGTGTGSTGGQLGAGGSGAFSAASAAAQIGGSGQNGYVLVYEYA